MQYRSITSLPKRVQGRTCTGTEHGTTECFNCWLVVSKGGARRGERTGERERAPPYEGERDRLRPYGERERSRLPPPPAENPPGSLLTYSTDSVRPALKPGLFCILERACPSARLDAGSAPLLLNNLTAPHGLVHDTLERAGGTVQAAEVGALERVSGLVDVLVLHKCIVALDLHAHKAAVGLEVALQVALARAVRVKVDHEQRRRRIGLPAPQVLAALHLAIALQAISAQCAGPAKHLHSVEGAKSRQRQTLNIRTRGRITTGSLDAASATSL